MYYFKVSGLFLWRNVASPWNQNTVPAEGGPLGLEDSDLLRGPHFCYEISPSADKKGAR